MDLIEQWRVGKAEKRRSCRWENDGRERLADSLERQDPVGKTIRQKIRREK
ncbi:hypothetical protein M1N79_01565 [Dehalococcoidia bacterium]|nr:hypothetical protein [Dehalococcoidia bacterium]